MDSVNPSTEREIVPMYKNLCKFIYLSSEEKVSI